MDYLDKTIYIKINNIEMSVRLSEELVIERLLKKCKEKNLDFRGFAGGKYINCYSKLILYCKKHNYEWKSGSYNSLVYSNNGCYYCGMDMVKHENSSTTDRFIEKARVIHGDRYDYSKTNYVNNKTNVCIRCNKKDKNGKGHGEFWQRASHHLRGHGCSVCAIEERKQTRKKKNKKIAIKITDKQLDSSIATQNVIEKATEKGLEFRGFMNGIYHGCSTKLILYCEKHKYEWKTTSYDCFINKPNTCQICNGRLLNEYTAINNIIEKCKDTNIKFHGLVDNEWLGSNKTYLTLSCDQHGIWTTTPYSKFINTNTSCPLCGNEKTLKSRKLDEADALRHIEEKCNTHDITFNGFVGGKYRNNKTKLILYCKKHQHEWNTTTYNGAMGNKTINCPKCVIEIQTQPRTPESGKKDIILEKCKERNYIFEGFVGNKWCGNSKTQLKIKCLKHKISWIVSYRNFTKLNRGCPSCRESQLEKNVVDLLTAHKIPFYRNYKKLRWLINKETKTKMELDFFLPDYNIAIECQGRQHFEAIDYFGGQKSLNKLKRRDESKFELCKRNNITILYFANELDSGVFPKMYFSTLYTNKEELICKIKNHERDI